MIALHQFSVFGFVQVILNVRLSAPCQEHLILVPNARSWCTDVTRWWLALFLCDEVYWCAQMMSTSGRISHIACMSVRLHVFEQSFQKAYMFTWHLTLCNMFLSVGINKSRQVDVCSSSGLPLSFSWYLVIARWDYAFDFCLFQIKTNTRALTK